MFVALVADITQRGSCAWRGSGLKRIRFPEDLCTHNGCPLPMRYSTANWTPLQSPPKPMHTESMNPAEVPGLPPEQSVEAWCLNLIQSCSWPEKTKPDPPPDLDQSESWECSPPPRQIESPGRPPCLQVHTRSMKTPALGALGEPKLRAQLMHTFMHHELQAAELFAWAVLAFPEAPREFRAGLVRLAMEELQHLGLYQSHLESLGAQVGDYPVRDWFWQRIANCPDPLGFVALQGLGLEGANLDHSARFSRAFSEAGDAVGAKILLHVCKDEEQHVAFARRWFEVFAKEPLTIESWSNALPDLITPGLFRGRPINRAGRLAAGMTDEFIDAIQASPSATLPRGERLKP